MLLAGIVVIFGRSHLGGGAGEADQPTSLVRSWIAISLVMGLVVFSAAALWLSDPSIRSTMFGGLIASVGAAIAFYFSSQAADKARSDILQATQALSQAPLPPTAFSAAAPPDGSVNTTYPPYKFVANGLPSPTFTLASGSLPAGLALGLDGGLSGTPTATGPSTFTVRAMNVAGHVDSPAITMTVS
jgi:hypothetical protein